MGLADYCYVVTPVITQKLHINHAQEEERWQGG